MFIVPNRPLSNEKLREFQVPLEQLERHVGATFHSDLDRTKVKFYMYPVAVLTMHLCWLIQVQNLCQRESCQLISQERMDLYFYTKK